MKNKIRTLLLGAVWTMGSSMVFADETQGFNPSELIQATTIAMDSFKTANPDHIVHLTGFKTWKSGVDAKVKFYVAHDGMTMEYNYLCLKHENQVHCNAL